MERPTLRVLSRTILLLENDPSVLPALRRILEIEGYSVLAAQDRQAALYYLENQVPDLIIADIHNPQLEGLAFYGYVRRQPAWITIPFIFLSDRRSPEEIANGRNLGAEDIILKPLNEKETIKIVHTRLLRAAELRIAHIDQSYLDTVNVLANSIEGRDPYTRGHVDRVARYARWLAEALMWPEEHLRLLAFGARLHDIGKIIVPDQILKKGSALTPEEWQLMRQHPVAGERIIHNIGYLQGTIPYIRHHHERWDGNGYPDGLAKRQIPIEARVLALADVYDALTTSRPYHPAKQPDEALAYIHAHSGSYFDPDLVPVFIRVIRQRIGLAPPVEKNV